MFDEYNILENFELLILKNKRLERSIACELVFRFFSVTVSQFSRFLHKTIKTVHHESKFSHNFRNVIKLSAYGFTYLKVSIRSIFSVWLFAHSRSKSTSQHYRCPQESQSVDSSVLELMVACNTLAVYG